MAINPTKEVAIYTDGACRGNPGPGGYGIILVYKETKKEIAEGYRWTTNNRMELMALVKALSLLKEPCRLEITTDSKYLLGGIDEGWLESWKSKGWKTKQGSNVQNKDIWVKLDELLQPHITNFTWVKGHADNPENNRCDELAVIAATERATSIDENYEALNPKPEAQQGSGGNG